MGSDQGIDFDRSQCSCFGARGGACCHFQPFVVHLPPKQAFPENKKHGRHRTQDRAIFFGCRRSLDAFTANVFSLPYRLYYRYDWTAYTYFLVRPYFRACCRSSAPSLSWSWFFYKPCWTAGFPQSPSRSFFRPPHPGKWGFIITIRPHSSSSGRLSSNVHWTGLFGPATMSFMEHAHISAPIYKHHQHVMRFLFPQAKVPWAEVVLWKTPEREASPNRVLSRHET